MNEPHARLNRFSSAARTPRSRRQLAWFALGVGGWAFAALVWVVGFQGGPFVFPGGDTRSFYAFAGDAFRSGADPYVINADGTAFFYAPPWAAAFAMLSWAGPAAIHLVIFVADLLALRYMARGWVRAGVLCWFLLVPWDMAAGQLNLIMAASIVAAVRGTAWPAAITALAKVSPALAVARRDWRPFAIALAACAVLTLPRLDLWPLWIERLLWGLGHPLGPLVAVPFVVRLPVAIGLVAWGRPWSRALGAVLATPGSTGGRSCCWSRPRSPGPSVRRGRLALPPLSRRHDGARPDAHAEGRAAADQQGG